VDLLTLALLRGRVLCYHARRFSGTTFLQARQQAVAMIQGWLLPDPDVEQTSEKLRGGYYTPSEIAAWLSRWAIRSHSDTVLEPSSGDGVFLAAVGARLLELGARPKDALRQISGVEVEPGEAKKAAHRLKGILGIKPNGQVACADFFQWAEAAPGRAYDCVVGNPPFIRYQSFPEPSRSRAMALMSAAGLRPNRLTNIWVPFVVAAATSLKAGGRLAFVLPAELLQVSYAAQLRMFLADHFARIHIFACNHLVFEEAEQEILLLLADGYSKTPSQDCLIELIEANDITELLSAEPSPKPRSECSTVDHSTEKWLKYFLSPTEIGLMRSLKAHEHIADLGHHAEIDIGVVTGRNEFFVVSRKTIEEFDLGDYVIPLIGRSSQLMGVIVDRTEWQSLADGGRDVHLLLLGSSDKPALNAGAGRYIKFGEDKEFNRGYKCSIRSPWYVVPSIWIPDCFLFRQIYDFPRAVLNRAQAISTDTIHRMRCKSNPTSVLKNLYTHLTAASAEIEGRSYGGGVLELEPTEAERLLMPKTLRKGLPISEIDRLVRAGKIEDVLKEHDRLILRPIGLSVADCRMLRQIWNKMRQRRLSRKK
jgi:adenine-specific DNA-methyltransferase